MRLATRLLAPLVLSTIAVGGFGPSVLAQAPPTTDSLEVILAIDTSASMRPALEAAKAAANEFVVAMPTDVRIGVETFADQVTVLAAPTADRDLLRAQIDAIIADGDTALYDLVVGARQHFTPSVDNKVLVVLSDGKDEGSVATLDDAIFAVSGIKVETISLTTAETDLASLSALGPVTSADDTTGVSAAFARIAALLVEVIQPSAEPAPTTTLGPVTPIAEAQAPAPASAITSPRSSPFESTPARSDASTSSIWLVVGAIGLFVGLFVLGVLLFPHERVSKARLGIDKPRSASDIGTRTVSAIEEALVRYDKRTDLGNALAIADISMKPAEFVAMVAVIAVVAGFVGLLLVGPLIGLLVAVFVCLGVRLYVRRTESKRRAAFADQLPEVLQLITTALRSGYGLTQALESISEDAEEPARSEFAQVLVQIRLGRDLSDALRALAQRMASKDLGWVVAAIDINRETGGNLSEVLATVSATIRERGRIARQVRTLTAEGRLSARILIALPLLMLVWQWRANPDSFQLLTYGVGLIALIIAGVLMIVGTVWVNRVVNSVAL